MAGSVLAVVYGLAAVVGLQWAAVGGAGSPVWPAAGVALAGLLLGGLRLWPAIVIARLAAALAVGSSQPLWVDASIAAGNALAAVLPALVLRRRVRLDPRLTAMRDVLWLASGAALGASIAAGVGTGALWLAAGFGAARAAAVWSNWWFGNLVGALTVAPLVLAWSRRDAVARRSVPQGGTGLDPSTAEARCRGAMSAAAWGHLGALLAATALVSSQVFLGDATHDLRTWHVFPVLIWAALAFRVRGAAPALLIVSAVSTWGATAGVGPFIDLADTVMERVSFAQQFAAVASLTTLILAALGAERDAVLMGLEAAVAARTAALRDSGAFLRSVLDANTDRLEILDLDGRLESMNANGRCLMELDDSRAAEAQDWAALWPEQARARVREAVAAARAGRTDRFEAFCPTAKGTLKWWDVAVAPVRDGTGQVAHIVCASRDITERKLVEAALREGEARFRAMAEALPAIVFETDARGSNLHVNPRFVHYTGLTLDELLGDGWLQILHPGDRARAAEAWAEAVRCGGSYEVEYRFRRHDGAFRWFLGRGAPVRDAAGRPVGWIGTCTDIDERKQAEAVLARDKAELERLVEERTRHLEQTQAHLAHARRMEALGQLAGGIAHDFNNVLQAVQGGAALIEKRARGQEEVRRLARMVFEAAGRGASITRRLLAFSRRSDLRAEAVDPAALLGDMREILGHTLGAGVEVHVEAQAWLPLLLADKGQLETVLVNLATNARDAMPGGGMLSFAAASEVLDRDGRRSRSPNGDERPKASVVAGRSAVERSLGPPAAERPVPAALKAGRYVRLTVSDTGSGMTPEVLARVTEPFFTTKPLGQGTGLGLAMAKGFAEQSGGALAVESAPGRGTAVTLWLPVAAPAGPAVAPARPEGQAASPSRGGRARILLVDDDAVVREVTAEQLDAAGYAVLPAESGPAALALLDAGEAVDLVISDLSMPGMDGVAVIREVQRRKQGLPAILLTGFATNAAELAVGGALCGAFSLLRKPVTAEQLADRAAVLLEGAAVAGRDTGPI